MSSAFSLVAVIGRLIYDAPYRLSSLLLEEALDPVRLSSLTMALVTRHRLFCRSLQLSIPNSV